jgi:propionyl-CoA carboxylase beta chain
MMSSSPEHNGRSGHSGGLGADAGSPATTAAKLAGLLERRRVLDQQAAASADRQHGHHKLTARERVERLVDPGTFRELDAMARTESTPGDDGTSRAYGDGVVTGLAEVNGRQVCLFSQDFTVFGGSLGRVFGQKVVKAMDVALEIGCPFIGINDSGGARIQEGVTSLALYGDIFYRNVLASGVIPQISIVAGPCAGGAVYSPAITDFTVMVDQLAHMFITGPDVIKTVTGEDVTFEGLGGAATHASKSGVAHYAARDEDDAFDYVRAILGYLPQNHLADPPRWPSSASPVATADDERLNTVVPDSDMSSYDMNNVISAIVDDGDFLEVHAAFAPNIICGFARVDGASVGLVANQPAHLAGTLDIDASEKAARFVRTCDAFNVPVVTLVDVPGFLPGIDQEWQGIIRRGSKLIYAYAEATVPKVTVITRKAYGQGLRRRLRRHGLEALEGRRQPRLADGRDRRHGCRRRCQRRASPRARSCDGRRHHRGRAQQARQGVSRRLRQPLPRRGAGLHRRRHPSVGDPPRGVEGARRPLEQAASTVDPQAWKHPALRPLVRRLPRTRAMPGPTRRSGGMSAGGRRAASWRRCWRC